MEKWIGTAGVCVKNNRVLMVLQGTPDEAKRWSVPSGGLEAGETLEECCLREIKEETGYMGEINRFLYKKEGADREVHYFQLRIVGGKPTIQDPDELIYAVDWKSAKDLKELPLSFEEDREWLIHVLNESGNTNPYDMDMHMRVEKVQDTRELSLFLAEMNGHKESHIGYCGEVPNEIFQTLQEDFTLENGETSFVIARDDTGEIVAAMGIDMDASSAEVWGPFNKAASIDIQDHLWNMLREVYPYIDTYTFFINKENLRQQVYMDVIGAEKKGEHTKLLIKKDAFESVLEIKSTDFAPEDQEAFEQLHQELFPGTYYNGSTIVERLNKENKLRVLKGAFNELQGYTYVEIDPEVGEASLEYIGISHAFRHKGLGTLLLKETLAEIFSHSNIEEIALVVENTNSPAHAMYKKAGCKQEDILVHYRLDVREHGH